MQRRSFLKLLAGLPFVASLLRPPDDSTEDGKPIETCGTYNDNAMFYIDFGKWEIRESRRSTMVKRGTAYATGSQTGSARRMPLTAVCRGAAFATMTSG